MGARRHGARHLGPFYRFAVMTIAPFMTVWTRRERRNLEILSATYPPNDGIIVAINHMSWFDPMNVCHTLWDAGRPPRFMAKEKLFRVPFLGQIMSGAGQIPVFRESDDPRAAISAAIDAINAGECVVVYPEGTMTRDPEYWVMKGRTGAAHLALETGAPVIPMAQWGPQEVMGAYKNEFKILPRKLMRTNVGPPVDLDDFRGKEITRELLHEATDRIIEAITVLLAELRGEDAPPDHLDYREWRKAQAGGQPGSATAST